MRRPLAAACAATVAFAVPTLLVHNAQAGDSHREVVRFGTTAHGRPMLAQHQWSSGGGTQQQVLLVVGSLRGTGRAGLKVVHRLRQTAPPDSVDLWTVRTLNPDGLARDRRWNGRGVDLNRNFPGGWKQASLTSSRAGRHAASEPETEALMRFVRELRPDAVVILGGARHSRVAAPDDSKALGRFMARSLGMRFVGRTCARPCPGSFGRWLHASTAADVVTVRTASASTRRITRLTTAVRDLAVRGKKRGPKATMSPTPTASSESPSPSPTTTTSTATSSPTPTLKSSTSPTPTATSSATPTSTATATTSPTPSPTTSSASPSPTAAPSPVAGGPFLPYSASSYFRTPLDGRVDAAATAAFRAFMHTHPDQRDTPYPVIRGVGGNAWGMAYAEGSASDPIWRLTGTVPSAVSQLQTQGFHAPEWFGAMLTGTSDSPFVVVDRGTGWSVWGAKSRVVGDHLIEVGAAGLFEHASNGLDKRNPASNSTLNFRSRGAIPDAMVIRKDLVDWGVAHDTDLGHVLHLFFVETDSTAGFRSPMVGAESSKSGWGAEGQRIAIDPSIDLTTRGLSPDALVIARTLQRYGAYLGDNAGGPTSLKAEQENSVHDVWHGGLRADSLRGITWDDFVVVPS